MRVIAVDIGTNSTLYLISDEDDAESSMVERGIVANKLGAKIDESGTLSQEVIDYNLNILKEIKQKAAVAGCSRIGAVGTQALRTASNSFILLRKAAESGIPVKIISEKEEALLAWNGVFGKKTGNVKVGLLDIGGGSSELSVGESDQPDWTNSIPVGAVSLSRRFFRDDPPSENQVQKAYSYISGAFESWHDKVGSEFSLFGIAGTVTALKAIDMRISSYIPGCLEGLVLKDDRVKYFTDQLLKLDCSDRERVPGMPPARAASIHAGAMILKVVMEIIGKREIIVSEKGVMFGLARLLAAGEF